MKEYSTYFSKTFIIEIDSILEKIYNDKITRSDFLYFFYLIDFFKNYDEKREYASFSSFSIRKDFGRVKINNKIIWVLDKIIKTCIEKNIIECTGYSTSLHKTRKYRYTDSFLEKILNDNVDLTLEVFSEKTSKQLRKHYTVPTDKYLLKQYNLIKNRLNIDVKSAKEWALSQYKEGFLTGNKYKNVERNINDLIKKDLIIVVKDEKTGRVYTTFNLMKRELRSFCTIDNISLRSVDLKSAQPFFLASHLLHKYPNSEEVKYFYDIITKEDIYMWLAEKLDNCVRDEAKVEFCRYLYKDNRGSCAAQEIIKNEFPFIYEYIKIFKRNNDMSIFLQNKEASIFMKVENKLVDRGCLSVHDSLYFRRDLDRVLVELDSSLTQNKYNNYIFKYS